MATEQTRRIYEALTETDRILNRARQPMEKHQDKVLIRDYEAHRAKLLNMLEAA